MKIDLMSISGHKIYGPKGIGALYVRRKAPRVRLNPLFHGGRQERNMRSGTLPAPLFVGLGVACSIAQRDMIRDYEHVSRLHRRLLDGIRARLDHIEINGSLEEGKRYPGNLNISFACVEGESLLMALKGIAVSTGSACASASLEPSYELKALGVSEKMAHTSLRFGLGRFTTKREVDYVVDKCCSAVERLCARCLRCGRWSRKALTCPRFNGLTINS